MRDGPDELPFASGRALHRLLLLFGPASIEPEDPHAGLVVERDVRRCEVLEARPLADQVAEHVVADLTLAPRRTDSRFVERTEEELERWLVDAPRLCLRQRRKDPVSVPSLRGFVPEVDVLAGERREFAHHLGMAKEDDGLNEREPRLRLPHGCLLLEEGLEPLRLPVRPEQRVLVEARPPVTFLDPVTLVAVYHAGPALDLDKEQAGRADDEEVDLVDRAVGGDELEQRIASIRVVIRQAFAHVVKRLPLPREAGGADFLPALPVCFHVLGRYRSRLVLVSSPLGQRVPIPVDPS